MEKRFTFFYIFLMVLRTLSAQDLHIEGIVTDGEGIPLYGAHVMLHEAQRVEITNIQGEYSMVGLEKGTYIISISYVGYISIQQSVTLNSTSISNYNFRLEEARYMADETVVTATGNKVARKDVSPAISIVSRKVLEESKESALLPVISEEVPGVFVTERGITGFGVASGSAGHISIRGVGGNPNTGVLVLIDGSPQYMGLFGHPLPDAYVTTDAEKVEVIRGPASMMYGSNAMAGVINIISRQQRKDGLEGRASLSYGSFNTWKASANAGYKKRGFTAYVSINHDQTDGHRVNSSFDITNGYTKIGSNLGKSFRIIADASIAKYKSTDPGPATTSDSSYLLEEHWIDIQRNMMSLAIENTHHSAEGAMKLFFNSGRHQIYDGFLSNDFNYGFSIYENFRLFTNTNLSGGFDFKHYGGKAENEYAMMGQGIIFADTSLYELGGYLMVRQEVAKRWIFSAGLRLNHQKTSGEEWVPQMGINYIINNNNIIKASVRKGFRYPTIRELYMWQPANADLIPESMWCYEGSYLGSYPTLKFNLEITAYYQQGSNLIQTIGQYPNIRYENTGEFNHYGIEAAGSWDPFQFLRIESNYSWIHMDKAITGAPEHQFYSAFKYHQSNISIKFSGMYIHQLYSNTNPESTQDYFLLNARISYSFLNMITLWVSGDNLLDRNYEINYDYPMPGINVTGGIDITFKALKK